LSTYNKNYLIVITTLPKSFFKQLFVGTKLGKALVKMNEDKALPKGLGDEEVERRRIKRPQIPYIPPSDPIGDAVKEGIKITRLAS